MQLRKLEIFPGKSSDIASRMTRTTLQRFLGKINGMKDYKYHQRMEGSPNRYYSHCNCGFVNSLQLNVKSVLDENSTEFFDSYNAHLEI